jgi:hypothetical protein
MEQWHVILITTGVQIVIGLFMAVAAFLIKRSIQQIDKRLEDGDVRFKELSVTLNDLREKRAFDREYTAKEYVAKDDFIRDVRAIDYKIDQVAIDVKKLLVLTGGKGNPDADI